MKLLRNREIRKKIILQLFICILASIVGVFVISPMAGALCLILGVLLIGIEHFFDSNRYRHIEKLSEAIDKLLHGASTVSLEEFSEGELAILSSEVNKLTLRLKEQNDALIQDKLRLSDAIADISHQLKTPLTSMGLTYPMLGSEELSYEKRRELVRELKKNTERLSTLVGVLLKLSKLDAGTAVFIEEEIKASELIRNATENLLIPLEVRDIELSVQCKDESFMGDMLWQSEAIGNIVKNCMEHTPAGGQIQILVEATPLFLRIIITDTGKGIDSKDLPHIFERFYKGSNSSLESYGIGLALARTIIMAQNGTIQAYNNEGGGAKFVVTYYKQII